MSTPQPQAPLSPRRDRPLNRWHRNAGIASAGVLIYLLATGIPLQFTAELDLGRRYVAAGWVLDWYGLQAPTQVRSSGGAVQVGGQLELGGRPAATLTALIGALEHGAFTVVAGRAEVLVFHSEAPEAVETIRIDGDIKRIGRAQDRLYLDIGTGLLVADSMLLDWSPAQAPASVIQWATVSTLTGVAAERHREHFRARMLTVERWLQDLHSGRFFGPTGIVIIDLSTALLLILAVTGTMLWWRFRTSPGTEP
jgi:hypothetical protein